MPPAPGRVLLISPSLSGGGNAVSARRLAAGLEREGVRVRLLAAGDPAFPRRLAAALRSFRPAVVHALHARKGGAAYLDRAPAGGPPLVLTLTGTEIHRDLDDPERARRVSDALGRAALVLSHSPALRDEALAAVPSLRGRTRVVPKGASLPPRERGFDLRRAAGLPRSALVFFLPAGVREVKDPLFALDPLARLREEEPRTAFVHAGEPLDRAMAAELRARARREPWIATLGPIPWRRMAAAYAGATVVLNTSRSEGLANSVVEAQLAGRPVLASDVPANRELVRPGRTGLLYRAGDGDSFLHAARRLVRDPDLRRRLAAAARAAARRRFDPRAEARAAMEAYRSL